MVQSAVNFVQVSDLFRASRYICYGMYSGGNVLDETALFGKFGNGSNKQDYLCIGHAQNMGRRNEAGRKTRNKPTRIQFNPSRKHNNKLPGRRHRLHHLMSPLVTLKAHHRHPNARASLHKKSRIIILPLNQTNAHVVHQPIRAKKIINPLNQQIHKILQQHSHLINRLQT